MNIVQSGRVKWRHIKVLRKRMEYLDAFLVNKPAEGFNFQRREFFAIRHVLEAIKAVDGDMEGAK